jgi:hypothetical protein
MIGILNGLMLMGAIFGVILVVCIIIAIIYSIVIEWDSIKCWIPTFIVLGILALIWIAYMIVPVIYSAGS